MFREVATAIMVCKMARYSWDTAGSNKNLSREEKFSLRRDIWEAEGALAELIESMDSLPPGCRQQLHILYYETHSRGMSKSLYTPFILRMLMVDTQSWRIVCYPQPFPPSENVL